MSLESFNFPSVLNTLDADIIVDFFVPALSASVRYDRGVGFSSAGWLRVAAEGMVAFRRDSGCVAEFRPRRHRARRNGGRRRLSLGRPGRPLGAVELWTVGFERLLHGALSRYCHLLTQSLPRSCTHYQGAQQSASAI